uniref:F-box protein SNE-like n=1 Tax=Erigeron canadensis TaxID=72917 RepID=UPI001CB8FD50|nr:F-box protein SNE-like [Erigeron canadensis]
MLQIHNNNKYDRCQTKLQKHKFPINDHVDILIEILQLLDGKSLGMAACVCKQWCSIVRNDSLWEHLCFKNLSPPRVRSVVVALGGYRRLYMVCIRPVVSRLKIRRVGESLLWNRNEVEVLLSLFCVEYYERLLEGGVIGYESQEKSLKFLCEAVNVVGT